MQPELLLEPPDTEPGRVGGDDEGTDLERAVVTSTGSSSDDVGPRLPGVGDEAFASIQDPGPAVATRFEPSGRSGPARIAPGTGLGQAVAADDLAGRHRDQEPLLLFGRSSQVERPTAQAGMGGHDQAQGAPDPADLLDRDRVGEGVHPGSALILRDRDAEPAELADPLHDRGRKAPRPLVLVDDPSDLADHELPDRIAQELVFGR